MLKRDPGQPSRSIPPETKTSQAEYQFDTYFLSRFKRLRPVRRFVIGWVFLVVLLIGGVIVQTANLSKYYQTLQAAPGGIYNEGVLGTFTNANPLYATSDADTSLSHLIFAGLFTYNQQNQLTGDLASSYDVDSRGTTYTVHLKPRLTWQDGQPLTAQDVVFTYHLIQNPAAQSPLQASWQGIKIAAPDAQTVSFTLPDPLASFPYTMTNGIVPEHLLATINPINLRSSSFNTTDPIGAGPFSWQAIQVTGTDPTIAQEQIALTPFANYQAGKPKLDQFVEHVYASASQLTAAYKNGSLNGAEGLPATPSGTAAEAVHSPLLTAATMTFFKTSSGVLADAQVRQALVRSANTSQIVKNLGYPTVPVEEPLLIGQLGYDQSYAQEPFNLAAAKQILDSDGWLVGKNGYRSKAGQNLGFTLTAEDTPQYQSLVKQLQQQWRAAGVQVQAQLLDDDDFQSALTSHDYDAVLYGISIGVDPDVFVYWDSSQANPGSSDSLNLSEWKDATADASLEAGRTRLNPQLRIIKYQPFLQQWQQQAPALGLYQPRLLYLTNGSVYGLNDNILNSSADRFDNVQSWEIRQTKVTDK